MILSKAGMAKSAPNSSGPQITYIFELELKSDRNVCKDFILESGQYTHGCDEPGTIKFEWYPSPDHKCATLLEIFESSDAAKLRVENLIVSPLASRFQALFEIKSFLVLGEVNSDLLDMLTGFGAEFREYGGGFYQV
ncbi:hypothetical protein OAZ91_00010 [bacterium]|nr:hypothetical protein [bacterium]